MTYRFNKLQQHFTIVIRQPVVIRNTFIYGSFIFKILKTLLLLFKINLTFFRCNAIKPFRLF